MGTFKSALGLCGLSQQEAADFLQVSLSAVQSWCTGRRSAPLGVWQQLASLFAQIEDAADGAADTMETNGIDLRALVNLEADLVDDALPIAGATEAAGAMALLMVLRREDI